MFSRNLSAGEFFELLRPAAFFLSALASTIVIISARNNGLRGFLVVFWTLGTLAASPVVLPLYLINRLYSNRSGGSNTDQETELAEISGPTENPNGARNKRITRFQFLIPLAYLVSVCAAGAFYFHHDRSSVDSYLARAASARLKSQPDETIAQYRLALAIEDNPHTHNLLGLELFQMN